MGTEASKQLIRRGRQTILPIAQDVLVEVCVSTHRLPALIFKDQYGKEAEITIEDCITLSRGSHLRTLEGAKPSVTFNPKELSPLLELLGSQVREAIAEPDGRLRIVFVDEQVLSIDPSTGYEAWHFKCPRPGRAVGGNSVHSISLTGTHGSLI